MKDLLFSRILNIVKLYPDKIALVNGDIRLSYKDLFQKSTALAGYIFQNTSPDEKLIGILFEKEWEQIVSVLGVLFSGKAYVPLDVYSPVSRTSDIINKSDLKTILTKEKYSKNISHIKNIFNLKVDNFNFDTQFYNLSYHSGADIAYIIFTSGTTGIPKGVAIQHFAVRNTIDDIITRFNISELDSTLMLSELNFDLSVFDIFGILSVGGTLILPTMTENRDPEAWYNLITKENITIWNTVPAFLSMFYEFNKERCFPSSIRLFFLSGDWVPISLMKAMKRVLPGGRYISLGGATEASIWSILYEINNIDENLSSIPYGKAMSNQTVEVLDDNFENCKNGLTGEIYIGGVGLAKEYWKDENKTKNSFIFNPKGERLYKTGDFGRYMPDGNIEFLGRQDLQVKINGYRIELGEVEAALSKLPLVSQSVAIVKNSSLYAFVTPANVNLENCKLYLSETLPFYMLPKAVYPLNSLPLNLNGKVDRDALSNIVRKNLLQREIEKPVTDTEVKILKIWLNILSHDSLGIQDDFFDIGGNSLHAVKLISRINKEFEKNFSLSVIFESRTVKTLADRVSSSEQAPSLTQLSFGKKFNLFLIHPVSGEIFCYYPLSQALKNFSVYGIQANLLGVDNLVSLAQKYCELIKQSVISPPYFIAGWSIGGLIAFEMAKQFGRNNVAFLGLIDAYPPFNFLFKEKLTINQAGLVKTIYKYYLQEMSKLVEDEILITETEVEWIMKVNPQNGIEILKKMILVKYEKKILESMDMMMEHFTVQFKKILGLMMGYKPNEMFNGTIHFFKSEEMPVDVANLWNNLSQDVNYLYLRGDHLSILNNPNVLDLAKKIGKFANG